MLFVIFIEGPEDQEGDPNRVYAFLTSYEELDRECEAIERHGAYYEWRQII